jgi:hypothetical protein
MFYGRIVEFRGRGLVPIFSKTSYLSASAKAIAIVASKWFGPLRR